MTSGQLHAVATKGKLTGALDSAVAATEFEHPVEWIGDATKLAGYMAGTRKGDLRAVVTINEDAAGARLVIELAKAGS